MLARTFTATIYGLEPVKIEVEVDSHRGVPNLILIGLATKTVEESKERITSALINCGVRIRSQRTVVNLAPTDLKKNSPTFELAIAVALLKMYGEFKADTSQTIFLGELSLNGQLKPIRGALPLVLAAKKMGFRQVVLPEGNVDEVKIVTGIDVYPLQHLQKLLTIKKFPEDLPKLATQKKFPPIEPKNTLPQISQQAVAKRALTISAAGGHNLMMIGPPGSGKSLLAKSMRDLLPALSKDEAIEVTTIYSICGLNSGQLITQRPFRAPHHTASYAGIIGGGRESSPGEITLAHRGILFLDEFAQFNARVLESLRQPLENKQVQIVRAEQATTFPANFTLVAAANPCPCGWHNSTHKACRCSLHAKQTYQRKFSGPIMDRFDLFVHVKPINLEKISNTEKIKNVTHQIAQARNLQQDQWQKIDKLTNSELDSTQVLKYVELSSGAKKLLKAASNELRLTARGYFRLIKVAQTIANLENTNKIQEQHLAEAIQYRQENIF